MRKRKHEFHEEEFTLTLAIQDTLPVLFFFGSMVELSVLYPSMLFILGASCSLIAGISKVVWKFFLALDWGNKKWLGSLFIPFQCAGFVLMIASVAVDHRLIHLKGMGEAVTSFPSMELFVLGILGMVGMITMSFGFDQSIKAHWKAQVVNTMAQGCFFVGLLFILL